MEKNKKVLLVVEDESALRHAVVEKGEKEGWEMLEARTGKEGLVQAETHKPDLIMLDLIMPEMGGLEMFDKLRKEEGDWGKQVPVIVLTNLSADEEITQNIARNEPAYYFVKTEWKIDDVITKIHEVLQHSANIKE